MRTESCLFSVIFTWTTVGHCLLCQRWWGMMDPSTWLTLQKQSVLFYW